MRATNLAKLNHESATVRVSGALAHHYQPEKPLYYVEYGNVLTDTSNTYILHFSELPTTELSFQLILDPVKVAHELYYQLRKADASIASTIIIELPPKLLIWQALRDRIVKAGTPL